MAEDRQYKFVLRKLVEYDTASSTGASEPPSDPWLDDQDLQCSTPKSIAEEMKPPQEISFLYSKDVDEPFEDKDLYSDLVKLEEEEKKAKQNREMEFEKLKKELEECRASESKNKKKIEEMTRENTNLQKSIWSLYRTAKSEIERKDELLAAANRRCDKLFHHYKVLEEEGKCKKCDYEENNKNKNSEKLSSQSSYYEKEFKENASKINKTDSSFNKRRRHF